MPILKKKQPKTNNRSSHFMYLEKEEQTKPKVVRTKEIIKISNGINENFKNSKI